MTALLEVQNLHKSYGSLKVTEDISFSINRGEALGVIGPNGAGKSTLFNLIAGGIRPDSGTVLFNGLDVTNFHLHERSIKGIGRSFQIPHPFGGMTVFENLLVGASFSAKLKGQDAEALAELVVHGPRAPKVHEQELVPLPVPGAGKEGRKEGSDRFFSSVYPGIMESQHEKDDPEATVSCAWYWITGFSASASIAPSSLSGRSRAFSMWIRPGMS